MLSDINKSKGSGLESGILTPSITSGKILNMARPLRIEYEGAVCHVTARGNERRKIFYGKRQMTKSKCQINVKCQQGVEKQDISRKGAKSAKKLV